MSCCNTRRVRMWRYVINNIATRVDKRKSCRIFRVIPGASKRLEQFRFHIITNVWTLHQLNRPTFVPTLGPTCGAGCEPQSCD
ncbi:unnamed protein product [Acanthoscelides obtectus]|uniref:Uncharacterized protein n=1 Tax=Acanthoscelides obtectus TaxID=200917 RepID=A0A9P0P2E4_ACAOB|nr:unnamed protein product [Acanthoscelides obtectus]CAK1632055.1 hypothetical protein AOBTE_LOCUS7332 [Acanthoscelides obtectus]